MRFYTKEHLHCCGIDLHARSMYVCILDQKGETLIHENMRAGSQSFLRAIAPYREDIVLYVECMFTWYWLADLCSQENIPFVLGHALYMKAIHGGKTKNDKIDSHKIAALLRTVPGIGKVLSLVIPYEIHDINRFPRAQDFASYARLVKCPRESAGKRHGTGGNKIGNMHLKWAFSEAAVLFLRNNPEAMKFKKRLEKKHGKSKALSILAHKLGRAVYHVLREQKAFDMKKFLAT
jgi:transposase